VKTLSEKIAVMQAALEGRPIERKPHGWRTWLPVEHPKWDWSLFDYRVQEPLEPTGAPE